MQVGNYIHNMATFFSGLIIGFINCWQIAAITLATGPFIVAAGGISNIFLHRLAENIQDAYAEAASIAEQVCYFIINFHLTKDPWNQTEFFLLVISSHISLPFVSFKFQLYSSIY